MLYISVSARVGWGGENKTRTLHSGERRRSVGDQRVVEQKKGRAKVSDPHRL